MPNPPSDAPPDSAGNRRGQERLDAAIVALIEVRGQDRSAILRDLSVTGAMFLTRARLAPGDQVKLLVFTTSDLTDPLELEGEVVRVSPWEDGLAFWPYSVGVRFSTPATEHIDRIREIGRRQAAMGLAFGKPPAR